MALISFIIYIYGPYTLHFVDKSTYRETKYLTGKESSTILLIKLCMVLQDSEIQPCFVHTVLRLQSTGKFLVQLNHDDGVVGSHLPH